MSFPELIAAMAVYQRENPAQRVGQAYFNGLHEVYPELADAIRGTYADPFYNDDALADFLYEVAAQR